MNEIRVGPTSHAKGPPHPVLTPSISLSAPKQFHLHAPESTPMSRNSRSFTFDPMSEDRANRDAPVKTVTKKTNARRRKNALIVVFTVKLFCSSCCTISSSLARASSAALTSFSPISNSSWSFRLQAARCSAWCADQWRPSLDHCRARPCRWHLVARHRW